MWEELRRKGALYTKQDAPELDGELYKYKKEYQKRCSETIVNSPFYNKINKHFLNFNKSEITIDRISELDKHPSAKGQEQIKEFIYDRLG